MYPKLVRCREIGVAHLRPHDELPFGLGREGEFGLRPASDLRPSDRPYIFGVESIFHLDGPQTDRAAFRYVVALLLEGPAEIDLLGRTDPDRELHGVLSVLVTGIEPNPVVAARVACEHIVAFGRDRFSVHGPAAGGLQRRGDDRAQLQRRTLEQGIALVGSGEGDRRRSEGEYVHPQGEFGPAAAVRHRQGDEVAARLVRREAERRPVADLPAVELPAEKGLIGVFVVGADLDPAARLGRQDRRAAGHRHDGRRRKRGFPLLLRTARQQEQHRQRDIRNSVHYK